MSTPGSDRDNPILYTQPEGLFYVDLNGQFRGGQFINKSSIEIFDLLSEGEIGGIVDREYELVGNLGQTGYDSYTERVLSGPNGESEGFLRSVFLNKVPVISSQGFYNFQNFALEATYGSQNGAIFQYGTQGRLLITRLINEKLRGSDYSFGSDGQPIPGTKNNFKVYKILNKTCDLFTVNIKITSLSRTATETELFTYPGKTFGAWVSPGSILPQYFELSIYYKPLYSTSSRNLNTQWTLGRHIYTGGVISFGIVYDAIVRPAIAFLSLPDFIGWEVLVVRFTPDSLSRSIQTTMYVDSITEFSSEKYTYPNSVISKSRFDAEYFSQIPARSFDIKGMKVKIPSTYDPILRKYTEPSWGWDGTFLDTKDYTNNPVWCFYDLLTNKRYGLGKYIDESLIDKFSLYEISKYCDQLVSDENGKLEPRFTCNLLLNTREEAFKILSDMASIFRAMTYYGLGTINVSQDAPKDSIFIFTNSNVENENFTYSSSAKKTRHNVAIVRYNDPTDFFKPAIEVVEDFDGIRKNGVKETDLTAFGCTSRAQAIRLGRWILLTENTETETVSFKTGPFASYLRPGDIFGIVDSNRKLQRLCGRTLQIDNFNTSARVVLDNQITLQTGTVYNFSLLAAKSYYEPSLISDLTSNDKNSIRPSLIYKQSFTGINGTGVDENNKSVLYFPQSFENFNAEYAPNAVWTLELNNGSFNQTQLRTYLNSGIDYYRVLSNEEEDSLKYNISALQYNKDKFLAIDSGIAYQRSAQVIGTVPTTPSSLDLTLINNIYSKSVDYHYVVPSFPTALTHFKVYAKTGDFGGSFSPAEEFLVATNNYNNFGGSYSPATTGQYYFRVYSYNSEGDVYSNSYAAANIEIPTSPVPIYDVTISSIVLAGYTGAYSDNVVRGVNTTDIDPVFNWQVGLKNPENPFVSKNFTYRVTVRKPTLNSVPDSTIYYQITGIAQTGYLPTFQFDFKTNNTPTLQALGGPFRNYDLVVEALDNDGNTSAGNSISNNTVIENGWMGNLDGYDIININNPALTGFILSSGNSHGNDYKTDQFFTASREGIINFTGNGTAETFQNDIVGGFIYTSPVYFSGLDAQTGRLNILRTECNWDLITNTAYAPLVLRTPNLSSVNYIGLSLYDIFDDAHRTATFYTGLYVAPSVPFSGQLFGTSMIVTTTDGSKNFTVQSTTNSAGQRELHLIDNTNPTLPSVLHTFA